MWVGGFFLFVFFLFFSPLIRRQNRLGRIREKIFISQSMISDWCIPILYINIYIKYTFCFVLFYIRDVHFLFLRICERGDLHVNADVVVNFTLSFVFLFYFFFPPVQNVLAFFFSFFFCVCVYFLLSCFSSAVQL